MSPQVERIRKRLRDAERDVLDDLAAKRRRWRYRVHRGRIWFDTEVLQAHRRVRQTIPSYIRQGSVLNLLTAPVIYSLLIPLALLDAWVWVYQSICFPIYGIAPVRRRRYFVMDRRRLAYLNGIEKANCTFCSYANGLFAYVREVAARTEQYWCPIKHARRIAAPHQRYDAFFDYGDAEGFRRGLVALRHTLPHRGAHGPNHRTRCSRVRRRR
jgi:hypothetical protein